MVHLLVNHKLSGILWYQGESDGGDGYNYRWMFQRMIENWRAKWGQAELPFLYVQLANWLEEPKEPGPSNWARLREAQHMAQSMLNTAMVTAIDCGEAEDIHPRDKQTLADRLVLAAKALVYHEDVTYLHPELEQVYKTDEGYVLSFKNVGSGLMTQDPGGSIQGFSIPSSNGTVYAKAKIIAKDQLVIKTNMPMKGMLRYLWADNPGKVELYSLEGLPVLPFERYVE